MKHHPYLQGLWKSRGRPVNDICFAANAQRALHVFLKTENADPRIPTGAENQDMRTRTWLHIDVIKSADYRDIATNE
ncbi:hypothetical protein AAP_04893 [Ascosphaera apis ARSEF 7405]|uniref:Uncharacterized protein n=1 Tax=Ascosphaera apis ARSEF 7405 TaxID=392613 RepID=A0A166N9U9_9EURO|nr:hypothetical protein AAP_04893 [Ascosphaera apis ARSEF 7405]